MTLSKKQTYKAFGLCINSEITLPELPYLEVESDDYIDVDIKFKNMTEQWNRMSNEHQSFVVVDNIVMFRFQNIAIFTIQAGKLIYVTPLEDFDEEVCQLFILGTCMGALLMQRKVLPLHGSAIAINDKAYAIIGESGAGKSTLARTFLRRGFQLLTDDVIAISHTDSDKQPLVVPSYPQQKLWDDSLVKLGIDNTDYQSLFGRINKYYVPVSKSYYAEPLPLAGVFELTKTEGNEITFQPIRSLRCFDTLYRHTYRNFLIADLGLMDWHFQMSARIAKDIDMYQLNRPTTSFTADRLVNIILDQLEMEVTM